MDDKIDLKNLAEESANGNLPTIVTKPVVTTTEEVKQTSPADDFVPIAVDPSLLETPTIEAPTPEEVKPVVNIPTQPAPQVEEPKQEIEEKKEEPPTEAVITIDKTTDVGSLGLTKEEHEKLEKSKVIKLIVMEDVELSTIEIERPDEKHRANYIKNIEGSVPRYSLPMPSLGDFITFKGAQFAQLINMVNFEDATLDEEISTKASFIYDRFLDGCIMHKKNEYNKTILSYEDFINKFPYRDMDMALYGILCASSKEENEAPLKCDKCDEEWTQVYNVKTLLNTDNMSDTIKERIDNILKYKSDPEKLQSLSDSQFRAKRLKSPFTNNIYDVSYPTIARAISIAKVMNDDSIDLPNHMLLLLFCLSRVLLYNQETGKYVEVMIDEVPLMVEVLNSIADTDMTMLASQLATENFIYNPEFTMKAKCPKCGKEHSLPIPIAQLVFLGAQDFLAAIQM